MGAWSFQSCSHTDPLWWTAGSHWQCKRGCKHRGWEKKNSGLSHLWANLCLQLYHPLKRFLWHFLLPLLGTPTLTAFSITGERNSHLLTWSFFRILLVTNVAHTCISEIWVNLNTQLHFQVSLNQIRRCAFCISTSPSILSGKNIIPDKIKSFAASGETVQH